jgi:tRNA nucleotidyltransferase (CCA-adding enzyme)
MAIYRQYMSRPYVMGQDLIEAGLKPCKEFSDYLAYAHKLRLAGVDKESALKQTLAYAKKGKK